MNKGKATVCTILYVTVFSIVLGSTYFVRNEELGINLYQIFINSFAYLWIANSIEKFYKWLIKE